MSSISTVQAAHDELLSVMPESASHDDCSLCANRASAATQIAEEVVQVTDTTDAPKNVYTEDQHFALLSSAVERETASLTVAKEELEAQVATTTTEKAALETQVSELAARIDVLEAEKAAETAAKDAAVAEFEAYKTELARAEQVETLKAERAAAVKAAASHLTDEYFTDERKARWAEMAEEQFSALVADLTEAAAHMPKVEANKAETEETVVTQAAETAAFKGGETAGAVEGSSLTALLRATGKSPVAHV